MADVNRGNRPLSPHLTIYKPQLNMITSILNRITGTAMLFSAILVVWWLMAAASGPAYFASIDGWITSFLGDIIMSFSVLGLWFHALGGVRHLVWDAGYGLDAETSDKMGWGMVIGSVALTFLTLIAI